MVRPVVCIPKDGSSARRVEPVNVLVSREGQFCKVKANFALARHEFFLANVAIDSFVS